MTVLGIPNNKQPQEREKSSDDLYMFICRYYIKFSFTYKLKFLGRLMI